MEKPFQLNLRVALWMQVVQIIFALPFTVFAILLIPSFFKTPFASLFLFVICVSLTYLGWANALSTIQITNESVTVNVFYGRFRIQWSEVIKIVLNAPFIALLGNEKRIVLSLAFAGKNSEKMLEFFNQQIESRNIIFEQNVTPFPITHQNARVWQ